MAQENERRDSRSPQTLRTPVGAWYAAQTRVLLALLVLFALAACQPQDPEALPTLAQPEALATANLLTENAPPPGFSEVAFPRIDDNLTRLSGWRYEMIFSFTGVFARTPRETALSTRATVTYDQVGSARRVVASIDNDLESPGDPVESEGVRLGPDTFLVREGTCLSNAGSDAQLLADLSAGDLLGGVQQATTAAEIAVINGEQAWRYDFQLEDLRLPNIQLIEDSRILELRHDLWVAPEHNVVVRFYVTMEVENVILLQGTLPVSGTVILRYDLFDIGVVPNITVPFGC